MNAVDKGLVLLQQKPLIAHVIARLQPQVDEMLINANREIAAYETFGLPVLKDIDHRDENAEFIGPLAGFKLGLQLAKHDYVLTVPCDSPLLPLDLADRLLNSLVLTKSEVAIASSDGNNHPVFCLMKKSVLPSLTEYLTSGERKVSTWQKSQQFVEVDFSDYELLDGTSAFVNLNTFEDLAAIELALNKP